MEANVPCLAGGGGGGGGSASCPVGVTGDIPVPGVCNQFLVISNLEAVQRKKKKFLGTNAKILYIRIFVRNVLKKGALYDVTP